MGSLASSNVVFPEIAGPLSSVLVPVIVSVKCHYPFIYRVAATSIFYVILCLFFFFFVIFVFPMIAPK